ncbi:hypothetical protein BX600DRAFT_512141 [Xylariales sp. PMI_506]|nr:hypothetical protein BX600DRAFT_512141 [Xylariales sp. PMI_506]
MADEDLLQRIHGLGDLDLAALLCLISREHCIISTESGALDDLVDELQLAATETFGLTSTVVNLTPQTTLDDFAASILLSSAASRSSSPYHTRTHGTDSYFHSRHPQPVHSNGNHSHGHGHQANSSLRALSPLSSSSSTVATGGQQQQLLQIANIILARDLDKAPKAVQIQALELLRTRRIFTRTSVQTAPKQFLFIAVLGADTGGEARLTEHLNDFFYLAHWHDPLDGFPRLEERDELRRPGGGGGGAREEEGGRDDGGDTSSISSDQSVVRRSSHSGTPRTTDIFPLTRRGSSTGKRSSSGGGGGGGRGSQAPASLAPSGPPLFSESDIASLALAGSNVVVDVDVLRYQMNLVAFMRTHHAVAGGIGPTATKHFEQLSRSMATLHGLEYVTPALVVLAARKVYLHRIRIVTPAQERSMQWGSELAAVEQMLDGVGPEDVIEDVIEMVDVPL